MNFEDLKDQIVERLSAIWGEIQESTLYNNIREKYEILSPQAQKAILGGGSILLVLFLISIPWSYLSTSFDYESEFEESKYLIGELIRSSRTLKADPPIPTGITLDTLKAKAEGVIQRSGILPDQKLGVTPLPVEFAGKALFSAPGIDQSGVMVKLAQLNIRQIVDIGFQLDNLSPAIKMVGLKVEVDPKEDHYYNVSFHLMAYKLPHVSKSDLAKEPANKKGSSPGGRKFSPPSRKGQGGK